MNNEGHYNINLFKMFEKVMKFVTSIHRFNPMSFIRHTILINKNSSLYLKIKGVNSDATENLILKLYIIIKHIFN